MYMTLDLSRRFLLLYFFVQTTAIQIGEMRVNLYRGTHDSIRKLVEIAVPTLPHSEGDSRILRSGKCILVRNDFLPPPT